MSGRHATGGIRLSIWRPITTLALLGVAPPTVIVSGAVEARSAPAPASADLDSQAITAPHATPGHVCRCGARAAPLISGGRTGHEAPLLRPAAGSNSA